MRTLKTLGIVALAMLVVGAPILANADEGGQSPLSHEIVTQPVAITPEIAATMLAAINEYLAPVASPKTDIVSLNLPVVSPEVLTGPDPRWPGSNQGNPSTIFANTNKSILNRKVGFIRVMTIEKIGGDVHICEVWRGVTPLS